MARSKAKFTRSQVMKAIMATRAAGLSVARVEIDVDGKIVVVAGKPVDAASIPDCEVNPWDRP